jgi:hypothetical protein
MSEETRRRINALSCGDHMSFWRKYLPSRMSAYIFRTAFDGRPVPERIAFDILDALDRAVDELAFVYEPYLERGAAWVDLVAPERELLQAHRAELEEF